MKANMQLEDLSLDRWEQLWAPYDEPTYRSVLAALHPEDTVLEIGAGDLRLARRVAAITRQVFAIEIQSAILEAVTADDLPENLCVIPGDARLVKFPPGITTAILLMRHCTHFDRYARKLRDIECSRLITNARWRTGLEVIDLDETRIPYNEFELGWYACLCGSAGFKIGAVDRFTEDIAYKTTEVIDCPGCHTSKSSQPLEEVHPVFGNLPVNLIGPQGPITLYLEGARAK
jgi:hypothetical protein